MAAMNMNHEQFRQMMGEGKLMLVDYWAPWCGYCRRIAPAYERIAQEFGDMVVVGKVNIDEEPALANAEQIEVIPTLVLYKDGKAVDFLVAPESQAAIAEFLQKNI